MRRKTISIDADVYHQLSRKRAPKETLSATIRRLLAEEKDPTDYLDELFAAPVEVDLRRLRRHQ